MLGRENSRNCRIPFARAERGWRYDAGKFEKKGGVKRKGVASLFDDYEIKDLFRRYIQLLIVVEVLIFLVCWVYQLGLDQVAVTGAPVDVPFPWKAYFLVAFSAPVALTF